MTEFFKTLLNIRSLRAACRDLTVDQIDDAVQKLTLVYDERKDEETKLKRVEEEKQAKLKEYSDMLAKNNISPEDLLAFLGQPPAAGKAKVKGTREPRPAKYRYTDGLETKEWTGQGRMPKIMAEAISQGKQLEDFLIK